VTAIYPKARALSSPASLRADVYVRQQAISNINCNILLLLLMNVNVLTLLRTDIEHSYRGADIQRCWYTEVLIYRGADIQRCWYTDVLIYRGADIQMCWYTEVLIYRCADIQMCWYTEVLISPYPDLLPGVFCLMVRIFRSMLVLLYIYSTNIPPIMIINSIYETQNLLSL